MLIREGSLLDDEGHMLLEEMANERDAQVFCEVVDTGRGEVGVRIVDGETEDEATSATDKAKEEAEKAGTPF